MFNSENFKIYGCKINAFQYSDVKINKYGTVTIKGNFQELNLDCEYIIKAKEVNDKKYGIGYEVINIHSEKPKTIDSSRKFLLEILTPTQTNTLLSAYPNIIDKIINNDLDDIDLNKTKGIKEYTFNVIKKKVLENFKFAELVDEFAGVFSFSIIKKLYALYPSVERIKEKLCSSPYECLCNIGGVGFKSADEMLLKIDKISRENIKNNKKPIINFAEELISSKQRMLACAEFILKENENQGNTYMTIKPFYKKCLELTKECIKCLPECIQNKEVFYVDKNKGRIARLQTYNTEKYIADTLKQGLQTKSKWDINIEKYRDIEKCKLTDEQMQTMKMICEHNIVILQGYSGVGKTTSTLALINLLQDNNKSSILLAPTGRASQVLQSYTHHSASTIHRGLMYKPPNEWGYNEQNKLEYDIVIVDEFSMVDIYLFKHLLESIDFTQTKLLLIGDEAQIPSISCGNLLHDLLESKTIPTVYLTTVFRYGIGGLSTVATDIRQGKMSFSNNNKIQVVGEDKGVTYIDMSQDKAISFIVDLFEKISAKVKGRDDIVVITSQNVGVYGTQILNNKIQERINPRNGNYIKSGIFEYHIGDPVIQCVNDYKAIVYNNEPTDQRIFISNGEIGTVKEILYNAIVVQFNGNLIYIDKEKLVNIKLAYAISAFKCQGGEFKNVIIFAPKAHTFMLNSNLLYVAVTRAKEKCWLVTNTDTYKRAIKIKENLNRNTFTIDLLQEK